MKHIQDPRITLFILLLAAFSVVLCGHMIQLHLLMGISLLYLISQHKFSAAVMYLLIYLLFWMLIYILPARVGSVGVVVLVTLRMMPMLAIGNALLTTPPDVILTAGYKMRISRQGLAAICILLRFSSVIRQEMSAITQGIRARGLLPHWHSIFLHPVASYECFILPLIIRALRLSSELTCAAEFRGVESDSARTCIYDAEVTPAEVIWAIGFSLVCITAILIGRFL